MKKFALALVVLMTLCIPSLIAVESVAAVDVLPPGCSADICKENQTNTSDADNPIFGPNGVMTNIINILAIVVGVVGMITMLIAGFMLVAAGGDSTKTANARRTFGYALAGLVIAGLARTIVVFVLNKI